MKKLKTQVEVPKISEIKKMLRDARNEFPKW